MPEPLQITFDDCEPKLLLTSKNLTETSPSLCSLNSVSTADGSVVPTSETKTCTEQEEKMSMCSSLFDIEPLP